VAGEVADNGLSGDGVPERFVIRPTASMITMMIMMMKKKVVMMV
jgi:hypothetical protein